MGKYAGRHYGFGAGKAREVELTIAQTTKVLAQL